MTERWNGLPAWARFALQMSILFLALGAWFLLADNIL